MSRTKKPEPVAEHHPKCNRASFCVGYDWVRCGLCSVNAALELVNLRTKVGGFPTVPLGGWEETLSKPVGEINQEGSVS